jgi:hypothetical protein
VLESACLDTFTARCMLWYQSTNLSHFQMMPVLALWILYLIWFYCFPKESHLCDLRAAHRMDESLVSKYCYVIAFFVCVGLGFEFRAFATQAHHLHLFLLYFSDRVSSFLPMLVLDQDSPACPPRLLELQVWMLAAFFFFFFDLCWPQTLTLLSLLLM